MKRRHPRSTRHEPLFPYTTLFRSELEDPGRLLHPRLDLRLRHAAQPQAIGHVVVDRHVRIERVVLEHHGDVAVLGLQPVDHALGDGDLARSEEHTSELQSLMRISYAVFCLKKKTHTITHTIL